MKFVKVLKPGASPHHPHSPNVHRRLPSPRSRRHQDDAPVELSFHSHATYHPSFYIWWPFHGEKRPKTESEFTSLPLKIHGGKTIPILCFFGIRPKHDHNKDIVTMLARLRDLVKGRSHTVALPAGDDLKLRSSVGVSHRKNDIMIDVSRMKMSRYQKWYLWRMDDLGSLRSHIDSKCFSETKRISVKAPLLRRDIVPVLLELVLACRFEIENLDDFGIRLRTITGICMTWMVLKQAASILDKLQWTNQLVFKARLLWHSYDSYHSYQNRLRFLFSTSHIQPFPSFTMPKIHLFLGNKATKSCLEVLLVPIPMAPSGELPHASVKTPGFAGKIGWWNREKTVSLPRSRKLNIRCERKLTTK